MSQNVFNINGLRQKAGIDRRESKRMVFYRGEFPPVLIEFAGRKVLTDVYDLSTNGMGILPQDQVTGLDTLGQEVNLQIGQTVKRKAILCNISHIKFSGSYRLKLGFETLPMDAAQTSTGVKYPCGFYMPMAYCDDPIAFNRRILFNVTDFSNSGLTIRTRNFSGAFFAGLRLELRIMMPARGEFCVACEVVTVDQNDQQCDLACFMINPSDELRNSISEFLLMNIENLTIEKLRGDGFFVADLEKAFIYRCASTSEELQRIYALRLKAAQKDGRWIGETDVNKMTDNWDKHARQVYCEVNGRIVAAGRVVFNNGLRDRSEHVSYNAKIPDWLWQAGFVEGSRVCTDPDFRGTDIFMQMMQHMCKIVTQAGQRYLVLNCVDSLVPVYKKTIGVMDLGNRFYTQFMQDKALNLLCIDIRSLQVGLTISPTTWVVNAPVGNHLIDQGTIKLSWWERALRYFFAVGHRYFEKKHRRAMYLKAKKPRSSDRKSTKTPPPPSGVSKNSNLHPDKFSSSTAHVAEESKPKQTADF